MSLKRCPKCQSIVDSDEEVCKYCDYQLRNVKQPKVVAVPKDDTFSVDGENFETVSRDSTASQIEVLNDTPDSAEIYNQPAIYSPNRIRKLRWGYFATLIISLVFIALGVFFLNFAIDEIKTQGHTDVMMGVAVFFFGLFVPIFIYSLVRFIQSFTSPVESCAMDIEREKTQGQVIGEAIGETIIEIISNL